MVAATVPGHIAEVPSITIPDVQPTEPASYHPDQTELVDDEPEPQPVWSRFAGAMLCGLGVLQFLIAVGIVVRLSVANRVIAEARNLGPFDGDRVAAPFVRNVVVLSPLATLAALALIGVGLLLIQGRRARIAAWILSIAVGVVQLLALLLGIRNSMRPSVDTGFLRWGIFGAVEDVEAAIAWWRPLDFAISSATLILVVVVGVALYHARRDEWAEDH